MEIALIVLYSIPLIFVFTYSLIQLKLVRLYLKNKSKEHQKEFFSDDFVPNVTVQLPLFNEKYVVERLIDCICSFDYPIDKLEIQVLDDSTDESFDIAAVKIKHYQDEGINIKHIKRPERIGFKAGALDYGLRIAEGEYIAIFDADFLPKPDFLKYTIPYFKDEKVGLVQTKWAHLNKGFSLLTRLQAFGLDAHFSVEQVGRSEGGHFINFNGTGGVWRKLCIDDAGGWSADTLTEDLDLSYRAQLKGWIFKYLEEIESPAELPMAMNALKNQQFRWTKGAAECAVKNLKRVYNNKTVTSSTKLHSTFHLLNSSIFLCIVLMSVLSVPLLYVKENYPQFKMLFNMASFFMISLFILIGFYWTSYKRNDNNPSFFKFLFEFPLFLSVSMGLSLHNSVAVIEGLLGVKSPFLRTPKFNVNANNKIEKWSENKYLVSSITVISVFELIFALYFVFGIFLAFYYQDYGLLPFHLMLSFGYLFVFIKSTFHSLISANTK